MKPLVYIAGPYTNPDPVLNVRRAVEIAEQVERLGADVFIPHLSMLWHLVSPAPIDRWYERDLAVLDRCDALYRFSGSSTGADAEVARAHALGLAVFYDTTPPTTLETFVRLWVAGVGRRGEGAAPEVVDATGTG